MFENKLSDIQLINSRGLSTWNKSKRAFSICCLLAFTGFGNLVFAQAHTQDFSITTVLTKPLNQYGPAYWNAKSSSNTFDLPGFDSRQGDLNKIEIQWEGHYRLQDVTEVTDTSTSTEVLSDGKRYNSVLTGHFHVDTFNTIRFNVINIKGGTRKNWYFSHLKEVNDPDLQNQSVKDKVTSYSYYDKQTSVYAVPGSTGTVSSYWNESNMCQKGQKPRIHSTEVGYYKTPTAGLTLCGWDFYPEHGLTCSQRGYHVLEYACQTNEPRYRDVMKLTETVLILRKGNVKSAPANTDPRYKWGPIKFSDFVCSADEVIDGVCSFTVNISNYLQSSLWCSDQTENPRDKCEQRAESKIFGEVRVVYHYTPASTDTLTQSDSVSGSDPCDGISGCETYGIGPDGLVERIVINRPKDKPVVRTSEWISVSGKPDGIDPIINSLETFEVVLSSEDSDSESQCWETYDDNTIKVTNTDGQTIPLAIKKTSKRGNFQAINVKPYETSTMFSIFAQRSSHNIQGDIISHNLEKGTTKNYSFRGRVIENRCDVWLDYNQG